MRLSAEAEHWAARYRLTSRTRRNAFSNLPGGASANRTELWMALRRALLRSAATGQLASSAHAGSSAGTGGGAVRGPRCAKVSWCLCAHVGLCFACVYIGF